jgi:hypothetical protein
MFIVIIEAAKAQMSQVESERYAVLCDTNVDGHAEKHGEQSKAKQSHRTACPSTKKNEEECTKGAFRWQVQGRERIEFRENLRFSAQSIQVIGDIVR